MLSHLCTERSRYIYECYQIKDIRKLEHKVLEFPRNCIFCRQVKGNRNSFNSSVNKPYVLG